MAKFDVDTIKKEANTTYRLHRGRGRNEYVTHKVWQIRLYARKVLFLCEQIEKLKKGK